MAGRRAPRGRAARARGVPAAVGHRPLRARPGRRRARGSRCARSRSRTWSATCGSPRSRSSSCSRSTPSDGARPPPTLLYLAITARRLPRRLPRPRHRPVQPHGGAARPGRRPAHGARRRRGLLALRAAAALGAGGARACASWSTAGPRPARRCAAALDIEINWVGRIARLARHGRRSSGRMVDRLAGSRSRCSSSGSRSGISRRSLYVRAARALRERAGAAAADAARVCNLQPLLDLSVAAV